MKKQVLFIFVAFLGLTAAQAQVKLGFGLGYAVPSGDIADITDGGLSAHLELGYGVTEDIDVSILYHGEFLVGADSDGVSYDAVALGSYLVNGRYYFRKEGFRPYGSLGLGITSVGAIEIEADGGNIESAASESNFSFRPALGFKYGVLNVNAAYLSAGKVGDGTVGDITFNIGLLFTFGGN
ncbi:hypothetical protein J8281_15710 [Aquimarina sp. U1-2]|uniref:hypothetical protein n=1 Tax=Aquimarina sp. U1-2 TaxID=2823141 RepID=UPI001AEC9C0F|nr:hypothetical protein [Aquimarina sp. U1-2]MBP2833642.1 hypothetical protein [Aquimarina sp. U1-2]